jgi:hypothetical protein
VMTCVCLVMLSACVCVCLKIWICVQMCVWERMSAEVLVICKLRRERWMGKLPVAVPWP